MVNSSKFKFKFHEIENILIAYIEASIRSYILCKLAYNNNKLCSIFVSDAGTVLFMHNFISSKIVYKQRSTGTSQP